MMKEVEKLVKMVRELADIMDVELIIRKDGVFVKGKNLDYQDLDKYLKFVEKVKKMLGEVNVKIEDDGDVVILYKAENE